MSIPEHIKRIFGPVTEIEATYRVNAIATYDDFNVKVYLPKYPKEQTFKGMELIKTAKEIKNAKKKAKKNNADSESSVRRTKRKIREYIFSNPFIWFVTFTFKEDRYDVEKCKNKMHNWLKNEKKRKGPFEYLLVAEFHKDGALHFHVLLTNYPGKIVPAVNPHTQKRLRKNGRPVYDFPSYTLGHMEAYKFGSDIDSRKALAHYMYKYITKDMPLFPGKKRYWISDNLLSPEKEVNPEPWYKELAPQWENEGEWGTTLYFTREEVEKWKQKTK